MLTGFPKTKWPRRRFSESYAVRISVKISRICEFRVIMGIMTGLLGCCSSSTVGSRANDYVKTREGFDCIIRPAPSRAGRTTPSQPGQYPLSLSGADQRKHQSSESLAFVRGIHQWSVNSPHKGPVTRKISPFDDVIMQNEKIGCFVIAVAGLPSRGMFGGPYSVTTPWNQNYNIYSISTCGLDGAVWHVRISWWFEYHVIMAIYTLKFGNELIISSHAS